VASADAARPEASGRIRTLIVDDEPLARGNLRIRLRGVPDFEVVGECATGHEAIGAVAALTPDVLFLDIRMPDMDGMSVVERLGAGVPPIVVFVTAFDRYALDAFRLHALDYLLKPFEEDRFAETLDTCRRRLADVRRLQLDAVASRAPAAAEAELVTREPARANPYVDRLVIKDRGRVFFLKIASVDWVEACADYVTLHVGQKRRLIRRTMAEMEERLPSRAFVRISRSAIVNLDRVRDLAPAARGEFFVRRTDGPDLKLTRTYRERLERVLGDRL